MLNGWAKKIAAVLDIPEHIRAEIMGVDCPAHLTIGAMQRALNGENVAPWLGPTWAKLYASAIAKLTVHNWRIESSLAHETRESCNGHCQATCRRDKRTGLLIAFDAEGQKPRQDAYWFNTTRSELQGESGTVQDLTPLGEIW